MKNKILIIYCFNLLFPVAFLAQDLEQFNTESQQFIYFFKGSKYLVPHAAASLENAITK
jgi:hypothetical protein